jgi:hypothetical protein
LAPTNTTAPAQVRVTPSIVLGSSTTPSVDTAVTIVQGLVKPGAAPAPLASVGSALVTTLDVEFVAAGDKAMRASSVVAAAIGTQYETVNAVPVGTYEHPSGIAFLVKTRQPVILPAGTLLTKAAREGEPTTIEPSSTPFGPVSYLYVILNGDFSVEVFQPVPDELVEHETS